MQYPLIDLDVWIFITTSRLMKDCYFYGRTPVSLVSKLIYFTFFGSLSFMPLLDV